MLLAAAVDEEIDVGSKAGPEVEGGEVLGGGRWEGGEEERPEKTGEIGLGDLGLCSDGRIVSALVNQREGR